MVLITILAVLLVLVGMVGSIIPGLPGPPIAWLGLLLKFIWGGENFSRGDISLTILLVMCALMIVVTALDYVLPAKMTKATGGSKYGARGALGGLLVACVVGLPLFWLGIIAMVGFPFLGAYLCERYWGQMDSTAAAKAAWGSVLGLLTGTGIKLIYCFAAMWMIF